MTTHPMPHARTLHSLKPVAGLLAATALLFWLKPGSRAPLLPGGLALLLLLLWLLYPAGLARLQHGMERLGLHLAALLSLVMMLLVYFLVLTPVALLMRAAGRDLLQRRIAAAPTASHWHDPYPRDRNDDFFKAQF